MWLSEFAAAHFFLGILHVLAVYFEKQNKKHLDLMMVVQLMRTGATTE